MTQNRSTWLGGYHLEGVWNWVDNIEWGYANWEENQPDNLDMNYCLEINGKLGEKWNAVLCDREVNAICEKLLYPGKRFLKKPSD